MKNDKLTARNRFKIIQYVVAFLLVVLLISVLTYKDKGVDTKIEFLSVRGIIAAICGNLLYVLQIGILYFGGIIFMRIRNLNNARP